VSSSHSSSGESSIVQRGAIKSFRDCENICPEMISIRAGDFMMGSPATKSYDFDIPRHEVHIGAFKVSKYPVTRGQWRFYATEILPRTAKNCDWLNPGFRQDDMHPVVCINWQEAQDYITWLNKKSGQHFRLLTEAEYEYVNRADTQTVYFWGDSDKDLALYANTNGHGEGTTPVGSFKANAWGLFDTTGNVSSWTQDCWHTSYNGAPTDGSARETGCVSSVRVIRGGSWNSNPKFMRSTFRLGLPRDTRSIQIGTRLARDDR
jgi:formylglycine-generating enzyme required for sulfatase activity